MHNRNNRSYGAPADNTNPNASQALSETDRLFLQISEQEKALDQLYRDIGKQYCAYIVRQERIPHEFKNKLLEISEALKTIRDLKVKVKKLKGIRACEFCGADVPADSSFCINCGQPVKPAEKAVNPNTFTCPKCGTENAKDALFCSVCGTRAEAAESPTVSLPFSPGGPVKCAVCGNELDADSDFCSYCGNRVGRAGSAPDYAPRPAARFCLNCGKQLEDDEDFCSECGTKAN